MKKVAYIVGGILIGFVLSTSTGVFADSVKSLVGKKVSGEYTIVVNGEKLTDKGAIIDGKANVPVREYSKALGADVTVSGKTITVTTTSQSEDIDQGSDNKYTGQSKTSIESSLKVLRENILEPTIKGREEIVSEIKRLTEAGADEVVIDSRKAQLATYDADIAKANADIAQAEAALAALK